MKPRGSMMMIDSRRRNRTDAPTEPAVRREKNHKDECLREGEAPTEPRLYQRINRRRLTRRFALPEL
jgi:hypothetical protein